MRINPCKGEWLHLWVRLNKSSMRVCVTLVISLKSCGNFWWFFPPCVYRNTWDKSTHAPPLSYIPLWDLACHILSQLLEAVLIREPFTLLLCCFHPSLTPTFILPSGTLQTWWESTGTVTVSDPIATFWAQTGKVLLQWIMLTNWKMGLKSSGYVERRCRLKNALALQVKPCLHQTMKMRPY